MNRIYTTNARAYKRANRNEVLQKRILGIVGLIALVILLGACKKEIEAPVFDARLETNADSVYAGSIATFNFSGSKADNITIYTGDPGHDYSKSPANKGAAITTPYGYYYYAYPQGGTFTVTIIAVNSGNEGTEFKETVKTFTVNVKDKRALGIAKLIVKAGTVASPAATFNTNKDTITVLVEPGTNRAKLNPVVTKTVDSAKVYYGANETLLGAKDSIDLTAPVTFTVKSTANPSVKKYTVVVKERAKTKANYLLTLTTTNKKVSISKPDTAKKTISIKIPWGVSVRADSIAVILTATTSPNATASLWDIKIDGKIGYILTVNQKDSITVTAENGNKKAYKFTPTQDSAFTAFSLNDSLSSLTASSQLVTINHTTHTIVVKLLGSDTKLLKKGYIATFKGTDYATVSVGTTKQENGKTKNSYVTPLVYSIKSKETGQTTSYTVSISLVQ